MKRVLLACAAILALWVAVPTGAGLPMALRTPDGAATGNAAIITSVSAISDMSSGSLVVWAKADNTSNSTRSIVAKPVTNGGWELFKRGTDGTVLRFARYRAAGSATTIDSPSGTIRAGVPQFWFISWDTSTSGNNKMWLGTLAAPASNASPTVTLGTGASSTDVSRNVTIGNSTGSAGWPGVIWAVGLSRSITMNAEEIRRLQDDFKPANLRSCIGMWILNARPARDLCSTNHAVISGTATLSNDALPRVAWRRPT
jgi:hypothetical protein